MVGLTLLKVTEGDRVINSGIYKFSGDGFETCAFCNRLTAVRRNTPIDQRAYYEEGLGQFHKECHEYVNGKRQEPPSMVTVYGPSPFAILRKRGFRAFLTDLLAD